MLKKLLFLYLFLLSPLFASHNEQIILKYFEDKDDLPISSISLQPQEETPEQILEANKHKPEFMSCSDWLKQKHPDFLEEKFSSHPLYHVLQEAIQLADFDVDTLEGFTHIYMKTDIAEENADTFHKLRISAMGAKNIVAYLIDLLQEKTTIEKVTTSYFSGRFEALIEYQADLTQRRPSLIGGSENVKVVRLDSTTDDQYSLLRTGFMRSYNIKNKIMRDLLFFLRDQSSEPLHNYLPPELINFISLSPSLHPFLNKVDETWVDYDLALKMGEARNFLGNAANLGVDLKQLFQRSNIHGFRIPKTYKKISEMSLPDFLLEGKKEERPKIVISHEPKKKKAKDKKKKKNLKKRENNVGLLPTSKVEPPVSTSSTANLLTKPQETFTIPIETPAKKEETLSTENKKPTVSLKENSQVPVLKRQTSLKSPLLPNHEKIGNSHVSTIYDIFRPKGYTSLDDHKIITAWNHILKGKGHHKEDTGRSHQPLYATLDDGQRVVLGLFRSSSYGPRYVKYIREAFEKIGFGKKWLEQQGYVLD